MDVDTCRSCGFSPLSDPVCASYRERGGLFTPAQGGEGGARPSIRHCVACEAARSLSRWVDGGCSSTWASPSGTFVAWMPEMTQAFASVIGKVALALPHVVKSHEGTLHAAIERVSLRGRSPGRSPTNDDFPDPHDEDGFGAVAARAPSVADKAEDGVRHLMAFVSRRRADQGIVALRRGLARASECRVFVDGLRVFDGIDVDEFGFPADGSDRRDAPKVGGWFEQGTLAGLSVETINKMGGYLA